MQSGAMPPAGAAMFEVCLEVKNLLDDVPRLLKCSLRDLPLLSAPYALELALSTQEYGCRQNLKVCLHTITRKLSSNSFCSQRSKWPFFFDVLDRLVLLFVALPPGVCTQQRDVDSYSKFVRAMPSLVDALERYRVRVVAEALARSERAAADPSRNPSGYESCEDDSDDSDCTDSESEDERRQGRPGPSKTFQPVMQVKMTQGQRKKAMRGGVVKAVDPAVEEARLREEDRALLHKNGISTPRSEADVRGALKEIKEVLIESLDTFVKAIKESGVKAYILDKYMRKHGLEERQQRAAPATSASGDNMVSERQVKPLPKRDVAQGSSKIEASSSQTGTSSAPVRVTASTPANTAARAIEAPTQRANTTASESEAITNSDPATRPLRAARLFDCTSSDLGAWQIYFSSRAVAHLRQLDQKTKIHVSKKIISLSHGHFSADNMKRLNAVADIPIYEAKSTRDLRIVYQVALHTDAEASLERQVLRIWGILTHAQIDGRLWSAVSQELGNGRSAEYRRRITARAAVRKVFGDRIEDCIDPMTFDADTTSQAITANGRTQAKQITLTENEYIELHDMLALQKWTPFSRSLLNTAIAEVEDATHVFCLSPQEQQVVQCEDSLFVIGRSGTGKTSCALFRLLGIEETYKHEPKKVRQLFVTKSPLLAYKIKDYYLRLSATYDASSLTRQEMAAIKTRREDDALDLVDAAEMQNALPSRWSDLNDSHFPLFLSFAQLCSLIEADLGINKISHANILAERKAAKKAMSKRRDEPDTVDDMQTQLFAPGSNNLPAADVRNAWIHQVDSAAFVKNYFPHFDQTLKKSLDPLLLFSEFVGVISGGEQTLEAEHFQRGYLDKTAYLQLSERAQSTFKDKREQVYQLYLQYRSMKSQRGDWDAADRTLAILTAAEKQQLLRQVDSLFVDESQDQLLIDTHLLRALVRNPRGHMWVGDTAQTISSTAFRFQDLSSTFYRAEQAEPLVMRGARAAIQPRMYHLSVNYRSHRGITNTAACLVDLLAFFFPNAIDTLSREEGIVDGPLPIIFSGFLEADLPIETMILGTQDASIEFGAEQCIVVRDEESREELRRKIGEDALCLTIYETKGLEFSDVLLYKCIDNSSITQWRVLLNFLGHDGKYPQFDPTRHGGLLSELRNLYVAATRARNRLWIFDLSDKNDAIKTILETRGLISICRPGDKLPSMSVSSTPQQWAKTGKQLFDRALYRQAANCYARAGKEIEADISMAYAQREKARDALRSSLPTKEARDLWNKVGTMFTAAADKDTITSTSKYAINLYRRAAECFLEAGAYLQAGQAYEKAKEWTTAARLYRLQRHYKEALRVLKAHPPASMEWIAPKFDRTDARLEEAEANHCLDIVRLHFVRANDLKTLRELFPTDEDELEWLDDYGYDVSVTDVLASLGQHEAVARIHVKASRHADAGKAYLLADKPILAAECFVQHLVQLAPLGVNRAELLNDRTTYQHVKSTLHKLNGLETDTSTNTTIQVYRNLIDSKDCDFDRDELTALAPMAADLRCLILDARLQRQQPFDANNIDSLLLQLEALDRYAEVLEPICVRGDLPQGLFGRMGISAMASGDALTDTRQFVPFSSPISTKIAQALAEAGDTGVVVDAKHLLLPIASLFRQRMLTIVIAALQQGLDMPQVYPPCLSFTLSRECPRRSDCKEQHLTSDYSRQFQTRIVLLSYFFALTRFTWSEGHERSRGVPSTYQKLRTKWFNLVCRTLLPSADGSGSYYFVAQIHNLLHPHFRETLRDELMHGLHGLSNVRSQQTYFSKMSLHSVLASRVAADRYAAEFNKLSAAWFTGWYDAYGNHRSPTITERDEMAATGEVLVVTTTMPVQPLSVPLYQILNTTATALSVDYIQSGNVYARSSLENRLELDLNVYGAVLERMTVMVILGDRNRSSPAPLQHVILPEALARFAVAQFAGKSLQYYDQPAAICAERLAYISIEILCEARDVKPRFTMNGQPIMGSDRPLAAYRFIRLLALMAVNNRGDRMQPMLVKDRVLQHFRDIARAVQTEAERRVSPGQRPLNLTGKVLTGFLHAKTFQDLGACLTRQSVAGRLDELVMLQIGSTHLWTPPKGVRIVRAATLLDLSLRWRGMPETTPPISKATTQAKTQPLSLSFPQAWLAASSRKGAGFPVAADDSAASTADVSTTLTAEPFKPATGEAAEVDAAQIPLPTEDNDEDQDADLREFEVMDEQPDPDASFIGTSDQIFDPVANMTQDAAKDKVPEAQDTAASRIARQWRRHLERRRWKTLQTLAINEPTWILLKRLVQALPDVPARRAYTYALVNGYTDLVQALEQAIAKGTDAKKAVSKKGIDKHGDLDLELHRSRITAAQSVLMQLREHKAAIKAVLPRGSFDEIRSLLSTVAKTLRELSAIPTMKRDAMAKVQELFDRGAALFEAEEVKPPTAARAPKPSLNTDDLDD